MGSSSGIGSPEEAAQLAALTPTNGNTWTAEVLNTGKVDEQRFAEGPGNCNTPT